MRGLTPVIGLTVLRGLDVEALVVDQGKVLDVSNLILVSM